MSANPMARFLLAATGLALAALATAPPVDAARRHVRLLRSLPAADTVVTTSPASIQLWFSEAVQLPVTRIRLVGPDERSTPLTAPTQDASVQDAPVTASLPTTLAAGRHTVHWSTVSKDGHAVRGSFAFTLRPR